MSLLPPLPILDCCTKSHWVSNAAFWGFAVNPNVKLLLEAGAPQCPTRHLPIFFSLFIINPAGTDQWSSRLLLNGFLKGCLEIFHCGFWWESQIYNKFLFSFCYLEVSPFFLRAKAQIEKSESFKALNCNQVSTLCFQVKIFFTKLIKKNKQNKPSTNKGSFNVCECFVQKPQFSDQLCAGWGTMDVWVLFTLGLNLL